MNKNYATLNKIIRIIGGRMPETLLKRAKADVFVSFWGSKQIDPYDLIMSKVASEELERDRKISTLNTKEPQKHENTTTANQ